MNDKQVNRESSNQPLELTEDDTAVLTTAEQQEDDLALEPPRVILNPGEKYSDENRAFQGIPGIERASNGRLWATWYGGGIGEGNSNYVMLVTSADDGQTWSDLKLVIDPDGNGPVRAFDECIWCDPQGRLWLFWAQSYRSFDGRVGVWAIVTDNPESADPAWSQPRRIAHGIMMNKPTVLSTGEWLLPGAIWSHTEREKHPELAEERFSNVIVSTDKGKTFSLRGQADVPKRQCDEHMIVERRDGSLWMLVRTLYGIGESFSYDRGRTWTPGQPSAIQHATARFFIRRLQSGNLLLIKHGPIDERTGRSHLTAYLSADDGQTWEGGLVFDPRLGVSYPDAVQAPDGKIYVIYDYNRHTDKEILMATFTEADISAGTCVSEECEFRILVNKAMVE